MCPYFKTKNESDLQTFRIWETDPSPMKVKI